MALAAAASEQEIVDYIGKFYGADIAAFLRIPDLRSVIIKAAREEADPQLVSTWLRRTNWYRSRSESMRTIDALRVADPAEYRRLVEQKQKQLAAEMTHLGLTGTKAMAEQALRFGWDEATLREQFTTKLGWQSMGQGFKEGSGLDTDADRLMQIARAEYLTPVDRGTVDRWALKAYQTGENVEDAWRSFLGNLAGSRFGIDPSSGISPADVMSPVKVAIAEALELNPESIDLLDKRYKDVLQMETSDGRMRPMTGHEASVWARSQDEFRTTSTAQNETADLVEVLTDTFGKT